MEKQIKFKTLAEFTAQASLDNPNLGWLEFVLTDNQPNGNQQGIKAEHFDSLIQSGMYMPIKVGEDGIRLDHSAARPLGPITTLEQSDNRVVGKAVVWKRERPEMYSMLKEMTESGDSINLSWEIAYKESVEEDGVEWLVDPVLTAATIVGSPAYGNRTPVTSIASLNNLEQLIEKIEQGEVPEDQLEMLSSAIATQEETREEPSDNGDEDMEFEELQEKHEELEANFEALKAERDALAEYKEEKEEEERIASLLKERVATLEEAGFEYSEEEIEAKSELWVNMEDETFNEMVSMMEEARSSATASNRVPDLSGDEDKNEFEILREGFNEMKENRGG